jgi:putative hemolysin
VVSLILVILLFLILSGFFSGSEIAFVSASKLGIEIKRDEGSRRGRILGKFFDNPEDFLGTMLVGNNIALVVFTYFMAELLTPIFSSFVTHDGIMAFILTIISTIVVLIFGEFLPKTIFRLFANESLYFFTYPLFVCKLLLKAPTWVMLKLTNLFMSGFVKSPNKNLTEALTRTDLYHYINETLSDFNEDIDKEIFTNVLNLNQLKVRDCMIPRPEIISFDKNESIKDLEQLFIQTKVSRILIIDGDVENVLGYVHHQQLLNNPKTVKGLILEIPFVPEAMNARDLMMTFINESHNIACVVDEFGSLAGIITLEDILEEIFGEIDDEHDEEDHIEKQISENEYLFSGRLEIDYLNETYENLNLPEGDYQTLSGYLVMTSGNIPTEEGLVIDLEGYQFVIEKLSDTKIDTVRVIKSIPEINA